LQALLGAFQGHEYLLFLVIIILLIIFLISCFIHHKKIAVNIVNLPDTQLIILIINFLIKTFLSSKGLFPLCGAKA